MDQIQRKKLNKKYLKIKKLTANLRDKDIELGRTLESKMKITNELMINLYGEKVKMPIENPDYLSLVRENKDCNGVSKEQLLTYIQVNNYRVTHMESMKSSLIYFTHLSICFFKMHCRKPQDWPVPFIQIIPQQQIYLANLRHLHYYQEEQKHSVDLIKTKNPKLKK